MKKFTELSIAWQFLMCYALEENGCEIMVNQSENSLKKEEPMIDTKRVVIQDALSPRAEELAEAAKILAEGGLVAFPTETVYGLGANALDEEAAKKIYAAKGRPSDNPLIAHVAEKEDVAQLVKEIPEAGRRLMDAFWPGPLTLIFPKSDCVPDGTTGGLDTVAVRMPSHPTARLLIRLAGVPVAAPSANISGKPSPTTAEHVMQDMNGRIDMVVDGGAVNIGVESTIVDVSEKVPTVLRPGAVTMEMLEEVLDQVEMDPAILSPVSDSAAFKPKAPGMKYRHYAPSADMILVQGEDVDEMVEKICRLAEEKQKEGLRVGIICTEETRSRYPQNLTVRTIGAREQEDTIAHNLFAVLREFDETDIQYILSETFEKDHLGQAIMNRLSKAAGYHIV